MVDTSNGLKIGYVLSKRGDELGKVVGVRRCLLAGCWSSCYGVRWPDGGITWPSMKAMKQINDNTMQVE
jgi:hypothetical protein